MDGGRHDATKRQRRVARQCGEWVLSAAGHPPGVASHKRARRLRNLDGVVTLAPIDLETEGDVPGIDAPQFQAYAEAAKGDCPVSRALAGIPEITLTAKPLISDTPRSAPVAAVAPQPLAGRWHQASTKRGSKP
jgi:hypothetical protein